MSHAGHPTRSGPATATATAGTLARVLEQSRRLSAEGRHAEAESTLREQCRIHPRSAPLRAMLGAVRFRLGRLEDAARSLRKAVKLAPRRADYHFNLGEIYRLLGRDSQALGCYRRARSIDAGLPDLAFALGTTLLRVGEASAARAALTDAVRGNPLDAHACNNLGNAQEMCADHAAAVENYRKAVELAPQQPEFRINLGRALAACGRGEAAIQSYWDGLSLHPDNAPLHFQLGQALRSRGRYQEAASCHGKASALDPNSAETLVALGDCLVAGRRIDEAARSYTRALALDPACESAHLGLGVCHLRAGRMAEAIASCRDAVQQRPGYGAAWYQLALNRNWQARPDELRTLQLQCRRARPDDADYPALHFARAHCLDRAGAFEQAFGHYQRANDARARQHPFEPARHRAYVDRLMALDLPVAGPAAAPADAPRPVFIVGMPRTGTTLVERILARHPAVSAGGEREDLPALLRELADARGGDYPDCLARADADDLSRIARSYRRQGPPGSPRTTHLTDKLPDNYLRLGLIARLFPDALVVHLRRDPRATCWSNYVQDFEHGLRYSYRWDHLASVYRDYRRIMRHWHRNLPLPVLDLDYEALVSEPDTQTRVLLAFCGLSWHPDCAAPEDCDAPIHTASLWQARQPIHARSVNHWRAYGPWLETLAADLDESAA